jgi:hypothetical protein
VRKHPRPSNGGHKKYGQSPAEPDLLPLMRDGEARAAQLGLFVRDVTNRNSRRS